MVGLFLHAGLCAPVLPSSALGQTPAEVRQSPECLLQELGTLPGLGAEKRNLTLAYYLFLYKASFVGTLVLSLALPSCSSRRLCLVSAQHGAVQRGELHLNPASPGAAGAGAQGPQWAGRDVCTINTCGPHTRGESSCSWQLGRRSANGSC
ncbi:hypothetical protein KIL84_021065 [Mauremys mutica]|uniref:Uncharacterized protein n=1 Tax=Mauremys mutica TaxID=74926 RepID=A0A9D3XAV2_9SAUR|nr:hypothetical protein KIL84_021065 [Mauremys mutica]